MISMSLKTSTNLEKNLMKIGLDIRQKVVQGMTRAAAVSIQKEVKRNAPNFLDNTIVVRKRKTKSKDQTHYAVTSGGDDGYLNVMYEYGTLSNRETSLSPKTKRKKHWAVLRDGSSYRAKRRSLDGGIKAVAHFRRAFESEGEDSYKVAKKYAEKRINKIIKSNSK